MKNFYELLGVGAAATADEIKRAFRREIARYHPDKVQHLGAEFQEIAALRAADLNEAYRVLMDQGARERYDEAFRESGSSASPAAPVRTKSGGPAESVAANAAPAAETGPPPTDKRFQKDRASTSSFVKKAAAGLMLRSVEIAGGRALPVLPDGFDAAFDIKPKGGLFKKAEPAVRLLTRFVAHVDGAAVEESWPLAVKAGAGKDAVLCLLLLGAGMAPANELSAAVAQLRRRSRAAGPVLVPVDVRDWEALFPPESPASVRAILQRLREGNL